MDESKNTITRSYSRKINLGNFEMADVFESRTIVMPENADLLDFHRTGEDLHAIVMSEVEKSVAELQAKYNKEDSGDWDAFCRVLDATSEFTSCSAEDFQKLNQFQAEIVNKLKKAYKRSPEWKQRVSNNNIENEQNRGGKIGN